jgi:hypothetical protein
MEDKRTVKDLIDQMKTIEKNNFENVEYISSMDLLLTSNNNGTVKDADLSDKFNNLKSKMREVADLTGEFLDDLNQNNY